MCTYVVHVQPDQREKDRQTDNQTETDRERGERQKETKTDTIHIGPLQLEVTWYKIQNIGEQKNVTRLHWET